MKNSFYYTELQLYAKAFEALTPEEKEQNCLLFSDAVELILVLHQVALKEGLLQLEEAAMSFDDSIPYHHYIADLILSVVDGIDPQSIEDDALLRYSAKGLKGVEGWLYLIYLLGALLIQAGEPDRRIEHKLLAALPREAEELYRKQKKEKETSQGPDMSLVESLYVGELAVTPEQEHYLLLKTCDSALISLDDEEQLALYFFGDFDFTTLITAMKGLSGPARKQLLSMYPPADAVKLAERYINMGPISMSKIAEAVRQIFSEIIRLIKEGKLEIPYDKDPERYSWINLIRK